MKITTKGQVTIPQKLRIRFGLDPETEVSFEATDRGVLIRPANSKEEEINQRLSRAVGKATVPITTDDIMRMTRGES